MPFPRLSLSTRQHRRRPTLKNDSTRQFDVFHFFKLTFLIFMFFVFQNFFFLTYHCPCQLLSPAGQSSPQTSSCLSPTSLSLSRRYPQPFSTDHVNGFFVVFHFYSLLPLLPTFLLSYLRPLLHETNRQQSIQYATSPSYTYTYDDAASRVTPIHPIHISHPKKEKASRFFQVSLTFSHDAGVLIGQTAGGRSKRCVALHTHWILHLFPPSHILPRSPTPCSMSLAV